jgi:ketosteroid isomerase-like protein
MDQLSTTAQKEVWEVVRRINAAWVERQPERLLDLFHDRIVIVGPDGQRFGEGKAACVGSYRDFCMSALVAFYRESDPQVDVYDAVAVVSYRFEIEYTIEGKIHRETGRDLFVLEKESDRWLAVWRQLVAQPV